MASRCRISSRPTGPPTPTSCSASSSCSSRPPCPPTRRPRSAPMTDLDTRTSMATYDEPTDSAVDDEVVVSDADGRWQSLLERLNDLSVTKHFDAYADVAWDEPVHAVDPHDPRWELSLDDPLGGTEWYQSRPQPQRAQLGLEVVASKMKLGLIFESILKRGLLEWAMTLPNNSPEFRYAYHEVIEEAQHTLMFQEFVNRS